MADYDNTNSGAAFKPFDSQRMILQGKVNLEGNESAPDYSGPIEDYATNKDMRIAAWKRQKDGGNYMSMQITEKQQGGSSNKLDDKIPF